MERAGEEAMPWGWMGRRRPSFSQVRGHHWGHSGQEERAHHQAYAGILVLSLPLGPLWKLAPYPSTPGLGGLRVVHAFPHLKSRQTATWHFVFGHLVLWTLKSNVVLSSIPMFYHRRQCFSWGFWARSFQKETSQ